jgi:CDP-glucose 4,6-dehydratase
MIEEVLSSSASTNIWRGKRVFLTGHTGFKGGWAALWLR